MFNNFLVRYYIINFETAKITIKYKYSDKDENNWHHLAFRDIKSCD